MSEHHVVRWDAEAIKCYQCGKCSAGCPVALYMDLLPNQVVRLVQLEEVDRVLASKAIWYCAGCQTCYSRCPQQVDLPHLMDVLCEKSVATRKYHPEARKIVAFHKSFLHSVRFFGRSFEITMIAELKARTLNLFQDLWMAVVMLFKGKLGLFPARVKNRKAVRALFGKAR